MGAREVGTREESNWPIGPGRETQKTFRTPAISKAVNITRTP